MTFAIQFRDKDFNKNHERINPFEVPTYSVGEDGWFRNKEEWHNSYNYGIMPRKLHVMKGITEQYDRHSSFGDVVAVRASMTYLPIVEDRDDPESYEKDFIWLMIPSSEWEENWWQMAIQYVEENTHNWIP